MAKRAKSCGDGKADFYPHFKRFLRFSRFFFSSVYELDGQKNLKVDCLNLILFILYRSYESYKRYLLLMTAYSKATFDNPYTMIYITRKTLFTLYYTTIFFEMMRKICHVKKVFKQLKIVDDKIHMSKKTEQEFSKTVFSYFLTAFGLPLIIQLIFASSRNVTKNIGNIFFSVFFGQVALLHEVVTVVCMQLIAALCMYYIRHIRRELGRILGPNSVSTEISIIDGFCHEHDNMKSGEKIKHLRHLLGQVDSLRDEATAAFESILSWNAIYFCIEAIYVIFLLLTLFRYYELYSLGIVIETLVDANTVMALRGMQFLRFVKTCVTLAKEGRKLSILLLEMLAEELDESVKKELTIFSAVLIHRQNEVLLYGLFPIDNSLFASIFSGIAVGLVVLLQFNFTDGDGKYDPIPSLILS